MGDAYRMDGGSDSSSTAATSPTLPDKRSRAGLFLSFQAPVEIPGRAAVQLPARNRGREGDGKSLAQFKKHVRRWPTS